MRRVLGMEGRVVGCLWRLLVDLKERVGWFGGRVARVSWTWIVLDERGTVVGCPWRFFVGLTERACRLDGVFAGGGMGMGFGKLLNLSIELSTHSRP